MRTNLNPLWVLKKYGSSKAIEGKPSFYIISSDGRQENERSVFSKIESISNLMNSLNINFLYALGGTIPFKMLGHMCLRPII